MVLDVQQLRGIEEFHVDLDGRQCDVPSEIGTCVTPLHLDAHTRKIETEVTIEGHISATIEMTCARCLQPYPEHIDDTFTVIYRRRPETYEKHVDEIELKEAELDINYYEDGEISLAALLREQLLLLLPVQPLCKPDCAGLCSSCGQNLNHGACTCAQDAIDPRLAVLKTLLNP